MPVAKRGLPAGQRRQRGSIGPKNSRPETDGTYIGKFVQKVKLCLIKPTLGAGENCPWLATAFRPPKKFIDWDGLAGLGAKQDMSVGRPVFKNS